MKAGWTIEQKSRDTKECVTVRQTANLDTDSAKKLYLEITDLLSHGLRSFVFDLHELDYCDSKTIGAWVMIHKALSQGSADLEFEVRRDSHTYTVLTAAKLDQVLSLNVT